LFTLLFDLGGRVAVGRSQFNGNADGALVGHHALDQAKGNNVPRITGILHGLERVKQNVLGHVRMTPSPLNGKRAGVRGERGERGESGRKRPHSETLWLS